MLKNKIFLMAIFFFIIMNLKSINSQITIKAVGDIMPGSVTPREVLPSDNNIVEMLKISPYLENASIVFGNLEGVFVAEGIEPQKCSEESRNARRCYEFGIPSSLFSLINQLNFNVLSIDNNHTSDYGELGYEYTIEIFMANNMKYAPKSGYASFLINNKKIGIVAFGFTHNSYHIASIKRAKSIVTRLKKKFDILIISFHGGAEGKDANHVKDEIEYYYSENRGNLVKFSHAVIDSGADLVIGHGPHVLRALELYKNKLIAYSLGNFLTFGQFKLKGPAGIGAILEVRFDHNNGDFIKGKIIPTKQKSWGIPYYDNENEAVSIIKQLTLEDFPNTKINIDENTGIISKK